MPISSGCGKGTFPVLVCPACGQLFAGAFIGEKTQTVVKLNLNRYRERGFFTCPNEACGVVWNGIYVLDSATEGEELEAANPASDFKAANIGHSWFNWSDVSQAQRARFLRIVETNGMLESTRKHRASSADIYDAEALCTILDLPPAVKDAVVYHVRQFENVDMRTILRRSQFYPPDRREAAVVATVMLVMERWGIKREGAVEMMLDAFSFKQSERSKRPTEQRITERELAGVYASVKAYFQRTIWREAQKAL